MNSGNTHYTANAPRSSKPSFLITIDTEGDNLWSLPERIETRNAGFLARFQQLCEEFQLRPTWLTNWEMAISEEYCEFARDVVQRKTGEIGMHLHAWNNPPLSPIEMQNPRRQACLVESSWEAMRDKIARITDQLENTFQVKMVSHRAGRWAMSPAYARLLVDHGYLVDCSVTPHVHWQYEHIDGSKFACDYRGFPQQAYWMDLDDIRRPGESPLLEVPMTVLAGSEHWSAQALHRLARPSRLARRIAERLSPRHYWFRPFRGNATELPRLLDRVEREGLDYIEFMIHSSELMPGGSPSFPTHESIERLYERLEPLFQHAQRRFVGRTLAEYRQQFVNSVAAPVAANGATS